MKQEAYACYCKNNKIRRNSSSGGIFYVLAKEIINHGGIVYAACYRKDNVFHERIDKVENIIYAQKSKYILSNMSEIREKIKKDLEEEKQVLFVGTPCQCASIIKQNEKNRKKLVVVDFICHGVSNTLAWKAYIKSLENRGIKPVSYDMRDKVTGWNSYSFSLTDSRRTYRQNYYTNHYMKGFLNDIHLMKACYSCNFATLNRISDLTLGDYWGIENVYPEVFDNNGTSLLMVNSMNGKLLFDKIKNQLFWIKTNVSRAAEYNKALSGHAKHNDNENIFWAKYNAGEDYIDIINELFPDDTNGNLEENVCVSEKMINYNTCMVAMWSNNYGNIISNYSLNTFLKRNGYTVIMLDNFAHEWLKEDVKIFNSQNYRLTSSYFPDNSFDGLNDYCDTFIVASDQIWNYQYSAFNGYGRWNHLSFVDNDKRKISYATSFGKEYDNSPNNYWLSLKYLYKRFDGISVREKSGVDILKSKFEIDNVENVVDPVFLCEKDDWNKLANKSKLCIELPYVFAYILDENIDKIDFAKKIAKKKNMNLIIVHDYNNQNENTSVYDWIYYIKNCSMLLTDSFHGVAMSIIMQKKFLAIKNRQHERFTFFQDFSEIGNRILNTEIEGNAVDSILKLADEEINFVSLKKKVNKEIDKSKEWLLRQLQQKKVLSINDNKAMDYSGIIDKALAQEQLQLRELNDLYEARDWFLQQIANKDEAIEGLKNWVNEIQEGKKYWEMQSREQERRIEELQSEICRLKELLKRCPG